ncbi:MAG: VWA domain-containing protein [Elusimicrobia bacterium]|nr:VWA domain-containing protein [Elusimicrobiota bacterium]
MFSFLEPLFAVAAGAGALGIIILHFLSRPSRRREFLFSNTRLLLAIIQEQLPRQRLRDRFLAVARGLCWMALFLALAKPLLRGLGGGGPAQEGRVIYWLVIDVSASMGYRDATGSNFLERSIRAAHMVAQELWRSSPSIKIGILAFDEEVKEAFTLEPSGDFTRVEQALSRLEISAPKTRQAAWISWLSQRPEALRTAGVYVFSDFARHGFEAKNFFQGVWDEAPVILVTPSESKLSNRRLRLEEPGRGGALQAVIDCFGDRESSPPPAMIIADALTRKTLATVRIADCSATTVVIDDVLNLPRSEEKALRFSLPADKLEFDDEYFWVRRQARQGALLIIDGEPGRRASESESFYVREALKVLRPQETWSIVTQEEAERLLSKPGTFPGVRQLWLLNTGPLAEPLARYLADFISKEGNTLFVASGGRQAALETPVMAGMALRGMAAPGEGRMVMMPDVEGHWLGDQPPSGITAEDLSKVRVEQMAVLTPSARTKKIWLSLEGSRGRSNQALPMLVELFFEGAGLPPAGPGGTIDPPAPTARSSGGRWPAGGGSPAAAGAPVKIFFWATTMDSEWTNLPLKGFFVNLVEALIKASAPNIASRSVIWGENWSFDFPSGFKRDLKARSPSTILIKAYEKGAGVGLGPLMERGIYQLQWGGLRINEQEEDWPAYVAVNAPPRGLESDLERASEKEMRRLSGESGLYSQVTLTEILNRPRRAVAALGASDLSRPLMVAALILLMIEGAVLVWSSCRENQLR